MLRTHTNRLLMMLQSKKSLMRWRPSTIKLRELKKKPMVHQLLIDKKRRRRQQKINYSPGSKSTKMINFPQSAKASQKKRQKNDQLPRKIVSSPKTIALLHQASKLTFLYRTKTWLALKIWSSRWTTLTSLTMINYKTWQKLWRTQIQRWSKSITNERPALISPMIK